MRHKTKPDTFTNIAKISTHPSNTNQHKLITNVHKK